MSLRLLSLNVEYGKHTELVMPFLEREQPDVICLQEAPEHFQDTLVDLGYTVTFAPMTIRNDLKPEFVEGLIFASIHPFTSSTTYYYGSAEKLVVHQHRVPETISHPVIISDLRIEGEHYRIATTHVMVTKRGHTSTEHQRTGIDRLLSILYKFEPHVLCGDFNMPREYNDQYEKFIPVYTDAIPLEYKSSLDKELYRKFRKDGTPVDSYIFEEYMVDYIFTQKPYAARDVRLQFGVSDHAAVIGTIEKT